MLLLTRRGSWRPGHGVEALHLFYGDVDLRADHEIEDVFPHDDVPATLNFRDLEKTELVHELDLRVTPTNGANFFKNSFRTYPLVGGV